MVNLFNKFIGLGFIVSVKLNICKDTDVCEIYICALEIYLMTVLSAIFGIIMDLATSAPCKG